MTRVFVIDQAARPSRDWRGEFEPQPNPIRAFDAGFRIMEAETFGWESGGIVAVAIYGMTATRTGGHERAGVVHERWQVFTVDNLGWVAWVIRPDEDRRAGERLRDNNFERLVVGVLILAMIGMVAVFMVLVSQCNGGSIGRL